MSDKHLSLTQLLHLLKKIGAWLTSVAALPLRLPQFVEASIVRVNSRTILWTTLAINLTVVLAAGWIVFSPVDNALFSVDALTEALSIDVPVGTIIPQSIAILQRTDVVHCSRSVELFSPTETPLRLEFTIGEKEPSLTVRNLAKNGAPFARGTCKSTADEERDFIVSNPFSGWSHQSVVLDGKIQLGQQAGVPDELLQSGSIITRTKSFPIPIDTISETSALMLGDEVHFLKDDQGQEANAKLLLRLDTERRAFHVVVHTVAARASVARSGLTENIDLAVAPSLWARLRAQSQWAIFALTGALLLNVIGAIRHFSETHKTTKSGEQN
ncbi:hypothetical protein AEAC466_19815 [Asticcacaulis sp. AC466]|uniref:hypothetical protein n=1 Tax=Asticcacaulis sp. AC466 TaxID=1282362 RepID=UPI0003C3F117|nr:hypothetical protein [Asticcacaulis sp. AC466]ESQ81812.1 hypothetical protein AEAC466_19815 [Asticcacaulis sp. AC466]